MGSLAAAAFVAGLLGGVHCAGMCGGIVGTLALQARGPLLARQLAFNAGRIGSYAIAGAAAGVLSSAVLGAFPVTALQVALFAAANLLMIVLGLQLAGWGQGLRAVESAGGRMTNWQGGPCDGGGNVLACGDRALHAHLLARIASA